MVRKINRHDKSMIKRKIKVIDKINKINRINTKDNSFLNWKITITKTGARADKYGEKTLFAATEEELKEMIREKEEEK